MPHHMPFSYIAALGRGRAFTAVVVEALRLSADLPRRLVLASIDSPLSRQTCRGSPTRPVHSAVGEPGTTPAEDDRVSTHHFNPLPNHLCHRSRPTPQRHQRGSRSVWPSLFPGRHGPVSQCETRPWPISKLCSPGPLRLSSRMTAPELTKRSGLSESNKYGNRSAVVSSTLPGNDLIRSRSHCS